MAPKIVTAVPASLLVEGLSSVNLLQASWPLHDNSGTLTDTVAGLTLSATATYGWIAGPYGESPGAFSATNSGYAEGAPGLIDTSRSFSVACWARVSTVSYGSAFVSQVDTQNAAFMLYYSASASRLGLLCYNTNLASSAYVRVTGLSAPSINTWYHLVGTYDASTKTMSLYVNTALQNTGTRVTPWRATGNFRVGVGKLSGSNEYPMRGAVSDVRVWQRVITDDEIRLAYLSGKERVFAVPAALSVGGALPTFRKVVHAPAARLSVDATPTLYRPMVAHWPCDDNASSLTDTITNAVLSLTGVWSWTADHSGASSSALSLTGGGYAEGTPPIDTAKSFTLMCWGKIDNDTYYRTFVSLEGTVNPAAELWMTPGKTLEFAMTESDGGSIKSSWRPTTVVTGQWYHIAGVFDSGLNKLTLYVNAVAQTPATRTAAPWTAAQKIAIGRDIYGGAIDDQLYGAVSDVRIWQRPLSSAEITTEYLSTYYRTPPAASLSLEAPAPTLVVPLGVAVPPAELSADAPHPGVFAGAGVLVTASAMTVEAPAPVVAFSVLVLAPPADLRADARVGVGVQAPPALLTLRAVLPPVTVEAPPAYLLARPMPAYATTYGVVAWAPEDAETVRSATPLISLGLLTATLSEVELETQFSTTSDFSSPITQTDSMPITYGMRIYFVRAQHALADGTYYWRSRITASVPSSWSASPRSLVVDASVASQTRSGSMEVSYGDLTPVVWYVTAAQGEPGDRVTVVGTGFGPSATVTVAGVSATVVSRASVPATGDSADRVIDVGAQRTTCAHDEIVFTIPNIQPPGGVVAVT